MPPLTMTMKFWWPSLSVDVDVGEESPYWALTRTGRNRAANARDFMVAERNREDEELG